MASGEYTHALEWETYTPTTDSTNGQRLDAWTPNGSLWCAVDAQATTRRQYDSEQSAQTATVRIHQFPDVKALDKLKDWRGQVWVVDSVTFDDDENETVVECYKLDIEDE
jgi:head-tail adaptor